MNKKRTYDNTNKGSLWLQAEKKSDKHPDYNGKLNINGVEHYISGWRKEVSGGKKLISLSLGSEVPQVPATSTGGDTSW